MAENRDSFLQKLHNHLFDSKDEGAVVFDAREQDMVVRYRAAFVKWLEEPHMRDVQMVSYLKDIGVSEAQAYRDLSRIKILIGNVRNATKEFQRYRASEMILKGYEIAKDACGHLEVKQAMAMIRAGEALVKVHKLDKNEMDNLPFEDIIPLELEPTTDISVIGRKKIENLEALKAKLRKKYGAEPIQDVPYTEVEN